MGKNILDEVLAGRYSPGRELLQKVERLDQTRIWQKKIALSERERLVVLSIANEGTGRGFIGEPRRTLRNELMGNGSPISNEAWIMHGEESEKELDMGFPVERKHIDLENLAEEDIYPDRHYYERIVEEEASQEEREEKRQKPENMLEAAKGLLCMLYGLSDESVSMEEFESMLITNSIIVCYLRERMDGVISYYFDNRYDGAIIEDILEFCRKMSRFDPKMSGEVMTDIVMGAKKEVGSNGGTGDSVNLRDIINLPISSKAKAQLIGKAQREQSRHNNHSGGKPACRLGEALFGNRWERLLRATV